MPPSPLPPVQAVVFDFDGTLARTEIDFGAIRLRLREYCMGRGCWDEALFQRYILEMIDSICERLSDEEAREVRTDSMAIVGEVELDACRGSELFPGIAECLATLESRGYALGIFTRNSRAGCGIVLQEHPLPHSVLLTRDDVQNVKPHPEHLQRTLAGLGCPPELTVVVGDHITDVETARDVGAYAIGVLTTNCTREKFAEVGADLVLESAAELADILPESPA